MTEDELRVLVRTAIARVRTGAASSPVTGGRSLPDAADHHGSHALFLLPDGLDAGGPCIIEPAVPCNHCGYCKSLGH